MDKDYEEKLIRRFIDKRMQDRLIFELASEKRREDCIHRFSHSYEDLFIRKYMAPIPKPNSDYIQTLKLLRSYGAGEMCYAISANSEIDGLCLSLEAALREAVGFGFPTILSCVAEKLLYFEAEQSFGAPPRFIIKRD